MRRDITNPLSVYQNIENKEGGTRIKLLIPQILYLVGVGIRLEEYLYATFRGTLS